MNETIKTIMSRRSTRVFKEDEVNSKLIEEIVNAGLYAPSGHNMQSWHFTVITNKDILNLLSDVTKEVCADSDDDFIRKLSTNKKYNVFYNAPVGIIVSGDKSSMYVESDVASASQNMLLAGESLGLGSCWIGVIELLFNSSRSDEFKEKLNIPKEFTPMHSLIFGYKKNEGPKAPERKSGKVNFIR